MDAAPIRLGINSSVRGPQSAQTTVQPATRDPRREFVAKLGIVEEEADESQFWMDLIMARGWADTERVAKLRDEARQLVAIIVTSIRTARRTPRSISHSAFGISH